MFFLIFSYDFRLIKVEIIYSKDLIMSATLKDIAKKSGFSVTTVSRALGGFGDVNEQTRQHIQTIADQLGYQPNHVARQLQGQRTQTIGFIMPMREDFFEDDFFSLMLKGITVGATHAHYDVLTSVVHPDRSEIEIYQRIAGGKRVDGIVITRPRNDDERIAYLKSIDFPFVVLGRNQDGQVNDFAYIDIDNHKAFELLVEHLIEYGHQHIGLILPSKQYTMSQYRYRGYEAGLQNANIPLRMEYIKYSNLTYSGGISSAEKLLSEQPQITAIICANDKIAIGAMTAIDNMGLQVGQDIAITGYDGIPESERARTPLTTIRVPIFQMGEQIARHLIESITKKPSTDYQKILAPELVIRESSGNKRISI